MLSSSRTFGSRQSVWPAKFIALSVATCPVNASAHVYTLSLSWTVPSAETRTWRRRVVLAFRLEAIPSLSCRPSRLSGRGTRVPAADGERAEAHGGPPGGTVRKSRLTTRGDDRA